MAPLLLLLTSCVLLSAARALPLDEYLFASDFCDEFSTDAEGQGAYKASDGLWLSRFVNLSYQAGALRLRSGALRVQESSKGVLGLLRCPRRRQHHRPRRR